ncbi:MAG: DUF1501 domain-containing protein [Verrucomicrobiota bacterium]
MHIAELAGKDPHSRRYFMEQTARLAFGVGLSTPLAAALNSANAQAVENGGGTAKSLIYIFCSGGMSHLDTFDVTNKSGSVMFDEKPINTNVDGIQMGHHFTHMAKQADKTAIINSIFSTNGDHSQGSYLNRTGYEKRATIVHPTVGPFAERLLGKRNEVLPDSVIVGRSTSNAGFLDPALSPLPIANPAGGVPNSELLTDNERFNRRMEIARKLGDQFIKTAKYAGPKSYVEYYNQANNLLQSTELEAFDLSGEPNRGDYGDTKVGQGCLLARRLVERGVRVVEVHHGGMDMHDNLESVAGDAFNPLDQAVATLLKDLESKGLLGTTLVAIGTEFGRTPEITRNAGRNHHPSAYSTVLAGGGIVGGQAYGASDKSGKKVANNPVRPEDFLATLGYALGVPLEERIYSASRRPFTFANDGKPVVELFG